MLVTVDIGDPGLEEGLREVLPEGSAVVVKGEYTAVEEWLPDAAGT